MTIERSYEVFSGVLQLMHSQVQYAESKSTALLTVNFATVVGLAALMTTDKALPVQLNMAVVMGLITLAGAGLFAIASFLPVMTNDSVATHAGADENLFFWGSIANMQSSQYAAALLTAMEIGHASTRLELDLSNQIIINAQIARRKYHLFYIASVITVAGFAAPVLLLAYFFFTQGFILL